MFDTDFEENSQQKQPSAIDFVYLCRSLNSKGILDHPHLKIWWEMSSTDMGRRYSRLHFLYLSSISLLPYAPIHFFMKHFLRIVLILSLGFIATSCLTFEESYTFNEDGTGSMELALDLTQLTAFVPEGPERDSLFMMSEIFVEMEDQLAGISGISNINPFTDRENMRIGISYDFNDTESLNEALNTILVAESIDGNHAFFEKKGNSYIRKNLPTTQGITLVEGMAQSMMAEAGGEAEQMEFLLEAMKYNVNLDFPSRVKVLYTEADSEISGDNHSSVSVTTNFNQIIKDRDLLSSSVVLK